MDSFFFLIGCNCANMGAHMSAFVPTNLTVVGRVDVVKRVTVVVGWEVEGLMGLETEGEAMRNTGRQ